MYAKIYNTYGYKHFAGQTIPFQGTDSKELFEKSKKDQSPDWFYHTYPVDYSYNSIGHRSMEHHLFEKHNPTKEKYILFTGCSFTEGIGLARQHTYSLLTANHFGMHCYNLGLGGSGVDLVAYNLALWLKHYQTPSAVVIQWPVPERKFYRPNDNEVHTIGSWVLDKNYQSNGADSETDTFSALMRTESFPHYFDVIRMTVISLLKVANIPFVEMFSEGYTNINIDAVPADQKKHIAYHPLNDRARDLSHPGIKWNQVAAERIIEKLTDQFKNIS